MSRKMLKFVSASNIFFFLPFPLCLHPTKPFCSLSAARFYFFFSLNVQCPMAICWFNLIFHVIRLTNIINFKTRKLCLMIANELFTGVQCSTKSPYPFNATWIMGQLIIYRGFHSSQQQKQQQKQLK